MAELIENVLREYLPAECDPATGLPLDWACCRTCRGSGRGEDVATDTWLRLRLQVQELCPACGGYGSLRVRVLAYLRGVQVAEREAAGDADVVACRCDGCGHRMSDQTWWLRNPSSGPTVLEEDHAGLEALALDLLHRGVEPATLDATAWSPCDVGCRHGAPTRWRFDDGDTWDASGRPARHDSVSHAVALGREVQASWRAVDVRVGMMAKRAGLDPRVGPLVARPFDLRPANVALLCLRCWAGPVA